jgi:hypothetical protein
MFAHARCPARMQGDMFSAQERSMHRFARIVTGFLAALAVTGPVLTAAAQTDRINDTPTGWWYYYGATTATIDAQMTLGRRPFNIGYTAGNYDAVLVSNSGEYAASGMDVLWGQTTAAIRFCLTDRLFGACSARGG